MDKMEYAGRLQKMIRCKTISVEGQYDDTEFAKLREVMEELFPNVHRVAEKMTFSDDCWVYKIKGKDEARNIMLMSHHDVVAAEGEWEHDAFSGEIAEEKIWGRGTVDTKTPLFGEFSALEELLSNGYEPPVNIYIGSSHNEELGGDGIPTALVYFKEKGRYYLNCTAIEGSSKNKKCTAVAFLRPVDGADLQTDIVAIKKIAERYDITIEIDEKSEYHEPADMSMPAFTYTMECIKAIFPEYPATPFILPAGTDARTLTDICPCVLRYAPIRLSAQQLASVHSENENIDLDAIEKCVTFYKYLLENYR